MVSLFRMGKQGFTWLRLYFPQLRRLQFQPVTRMSAMRGQGLVEYALILVLVAIVVIVVLALLGPAIGEIFSNLVCEMNFVGDGEEGTGCG